jgi:hypothetical protein
VLLARVETPPTNEERVTDCLGAQDGNGGPIQKLFAAIPTKVFVRGLTAFTLGPTQIESMSGG